MSDKSKLLDAIASLGDEWEIERMVYEAKNDAWWNALSEQEREDAFYAVVKRLHQAEIVDRGSYRYALYDVFGFDAGMYGRGMDCGFMALHNSIYTEQEMRELRDRELASRDIQVEVKKVKK